MSPVAAKDEELLDVKTEVLANARAVRVIRDVARNPSPGLAGLSGEDVELIARYLKADALATLKTDAGHDIARQWVVAFVRSITALEDFGSELAEGGKVSARTLRDISKLSRDMLQRLKKRLEKTGKA
jgi:hypothetical protein